jgi:hypothetical protein
MLLGAALDGTRSRIPFAHDYASFSYSGRYPWAFSAGRAGTRVSIGTAAALERAAELAGGAALWGEAALHPLEAVLVGPEAALVGGSARP